MSNNKYISKAKLVNTSIISSLTPIQASEYLQVRAERLGWIIGLRWMTMVGLALASISNQVTGYALFSYTAGWFVVPPVVIVNLFFLYLLRRTTRANLPLDRLERSLRWQSYAQSTSDAFFLTLLVYLNGGAECPILAIPLFAVIIDAVVLSGFEIFIQANLATLLLAFFFIGEYLGLLPHMPFLAPRYYQGLASDLPAMLGRLFSMGFLLNVAAYLCLNLTGRLDGLEVRSRRVLAQMREQVLKATQDVADSSAGLSHGAADVNLVAEQMASTIQQIAQGAAHQASQLENVSHNLEGLADASSSVARGAQETHQAAAETVNLGERGRQAAQEATDRMNEIAQLFSQTEQALQSLAQRSKEIGEIASAIDRFAERTDLLALNAGIEAARAGEHGRGFAVVAGEVKKLATSSSNSATRVAEMIQQIQDSLQAVAALMRSGNTRLAEGLQTIAVVQGAVEEMSAVIVRTEELAKGMEGLSRKQLDAHQSIVHSIGEIASAAEQTAAGAEQAAAAVEEQASTMSDFSQAVNQLAELAEGLKREVASLTVNVNSASDTATRGSS
jgi:methyl-accepting chemotaxis protein